MATPCARSASGGEHLVDKYRGEAERRFVQHQQFGFAHHRLRDGQHLLLSARQAAGDEILLFAQHRKEFMDAIDALSMLLAFSRRP